MSAVTGHESAPLIEVDDLSVSYRKGNEQIRALDGISLRVARGERVAVIGESGSGKSTLTHALLGILPENATLTSRRGVLDGVDVLDGLSEGEWNEIRRTRIAYVPQDPNIVLNPVRRIGVQLREAIRVVAGVRDRRLARVHALELITKVGLEDPERVYESYPHQLSGGQRQRILIAIALIGNPRVVIADEPTSGLDVTVQKLVLDLLDEFLIESGISLILVTHDLAVASQRADRVIVLRDGVIVEEGPTAEVTRTPREPYTRELLAAVPSLRTERLTARAGVPEASAPPSTATPILQVTDLCRRYVQRDLRRGKRVTDALTGVSLSVEAGTTYGLVGESGSGKSTLARIVAGLDRADGGTVQFEGEDIATGSRARQRAVRAAVQYVFQNPYSSLDPRLTVQQILAQPLQGFELAPAAQHAALVEAALVDVGLPTSYRGRRPPELSGGQRQRVAIARALIVRPQLVVLDEPVSALDVSIQAQILQLLVDLQHEHGLSYVFISHDLAVVRQVSDRIGILHRGELVEEGEARQVFDHPQTEYATRLLEAIPSLH